MLHKIRALIDKINKKGKFEENFYLFVLLKHLKTP